MTGNLTNRVKYTPGVKYVRERLAAGALPGDKGLRSLPAEQGTTRPLSRTKVPGRREHPDALSSSLPKLEPARLPADTGVRG